MSKHWLLLTMTAASTAIPYGLFGGFGPGNPALPWVGMLAEWLTWILVARTGVRRGWWIVENEVGLASPYLAILGLKSARSRADVQRAFRVQAR